MICPPPPKRKAPPPPRRAARRPPPPPVHHMVKVVEKREKPHRPLKLVMMTEDELTGVLFAEGAMEESFEMNRARLEEKAIELFMPCWEKDGYEIVLNPATVAFTYHRYPELHYPEKTRTINDLGRRLLNL